MSSVASVSAPLTVPPAPRQMEYSDRCQCLASDIYTRASACATADAANKVLWEGYRTVINDPATTSDEKEIARFGQQTSHRQLAYQEHNRMAFKVIDCLAHPIPGPAGQVLAQVSYKTARNVKLAETAAHVLCKGFDAVIRNSAATDNEKAVAGIGAAVGRVSLQWTEHDLAAFSLMQALCGSVAGPAGVVLAKVSHQAASSVKLARTANHVLWSGFSAIINNPGSTPEEKAVAEFALLPLTLEEKEHNRIAFPLMSAIRDGVQGQIGPLIARVACRAAANTRYARTADQVIWNAFKTIGSDSRLSEGQKAILELGNAISHHSLDWVEHNRLGFPVLEALQGPVTGSVPRAVAAMAYKAAKNCRYDSSAKIALQEGFTMIAARPDVTQVQKNLAQAGLKIDSYATLPGQEAMTFRYSIMEMLLNGLGDRSSLEHGDQIEVKTIEELKGLELSLKDKIGESQKTVAGLLQQNSSDRAGYDTIRQDWVRLDTKTVITRKASLIGIPAGISSGMLALALRQPLLAIPAALAAGIFLLNRHLLGKQAIITSQLNSLNAGIEARNTTIDVQRIYQDIYNSEIDAIRPQLDVIRSAQALKKPVSENSSRVIGTGDDDLYVNIGGIRLKIKKDQNDDPSADKLNPEHEQGHF